MAVNRIQANGTNPSPDRQDTNIVPGAGVSVTASDDATNYVSKVTVALGGAATDVSALAGSLTVTKFTAEGIGGTLASAATIVPTNGIHHVTGTTNVVNITPPAMATGTVGVTIGLIPDGLWATTNAGNIAIASTAVVSKILWMTYDPGTSKWYPSY